MYSLVLKYIDLLVNKLRILQLKMNGADIGRKVRSYGSFRVINAKNLKIGEFSTINEGVLIDCRDYVIIGSHCHISSGVKIHAGKLLLDEKPRKHHVSKSVIIKDNVWVASGCVISAGVTIGENSVIGANSVIISDVGGGGLYAGNPAKLIKYLNFKN
ncbi:acyltransferase [Campylobacter concisus]|jgi:putative acyl transferase protein|uniref:acyltransferase n=1 Tax=Campylobacter concisus TaxID=199 RepID=UPI000CD97C39|nr:acyltransferase [Campylobacter concisus]